MNLNRRRFLQTGTVGVAAALLTPAVTKAMTPTSIVRIAFLHLAPRPSDLVYNRHLVERAVTTAAGVGAQWILTPELCICGYMFADQIGTAWILPQPDSWMQELCRLVARLNVTVFLSHPERDPRTTLLHNSVFVIGANGALLGKHRKMNTLRVGAESWSSPGEHVAPILMPSTSRIGVLICADAYSPGIAQSLQTQGATLLVSSAAWAPGLHGPNGEWERCTRDNRTLPLGLQSDRAGSSTDLYRRRECHCERWAPTLIVARRAVNYFHNRVGSHNTNLGNTNVSEDRPLRGSRQLAGPQWRAEEAPESVAHGNGKRAILSLYGI